MVTIVDYGMGNLGSLANLYKKIKVPFQISSDPQRILDASKILLPGVGAFDNAMRRINESGLRAALDQKALKDRVPVLGICLGMHLLTESSEEGTEMGLAWVPGTTRRLKFDNGISLKVPHMGWNRVFQKNPSPLTRDLPPDPRFYFVHSYYVKMKTEEDVLMKTVYGIEFDSIIQHDNIFGAQFHPEKSHKYGMKMLQNFADL